MQISFIFICLVLSSLGIQRFLDEFFEPISINTELLLDSSFRNRSLSNTLSLSDALKLRILDKIEYESKKEIDLFEEKHIKIDDLWNLSMKTDPNMFIFESNPNTLNILNIQNFLLFNTKYELTIPAFSMFKITEPFLYGGFSQLNRKKNIKNLCFLNEIDGYISLSAINYDENINVAVIFYTKNVISKKSEYFSIKYFLRYYVLDNIPCSNQIDSTKISFFFELNSNKTYIPYNEIEINNSSMIKYIDLEEDFIIYSKEIDVYLFRSLKREKNFWIEEYAKPDQNDQYLNKLITRTLGIKLLSKYIEESRRLLVFTVQKNYKEIYFKCDLYRYGEKYPIKEDYSDNKNYKWEISSNLIKRDIDFDNNINKFDTLPSPIVIYNKHSQYVYIFFLTKIIYQLEFNPEDKSIKIREVTIKNFETLHENNIEIKNAQISDKADLIFLNLRSSEGDFFSIITININEKDFFYAELLSIRTPSSLTSLPEIKGSSLLKSPENENVIILITIEGEIITLRLDLEDDLWSLIRDLTDSAFTLVVFLFFALTINCIRRVFTQGLRIRVAIN